MMLQMKDNLHKKETMVYHYLETPFAAWLQKSNCEARSLFFNLKMTAGNKRYDKAFCRQYCNTAWNPGIILLQW